MDNNSLNFSEAKRIPIIDYLAILGFEPAKIKGNDYWYRSPFRDERTPSFKVNIKENLWYDHGVGKGGTILDLGVEIHQCTLRGFISKLELANFNSRSVRKLPTVAADNKLDVVSTYPIKEPQLIEYLKSRGIDPDLARQYCVEAEFLIRTRRYKAIAFPNNSGGYELRNNWFKGSSSPKDLSFISGERNKLCVLEGFIDFLSVLQAPDKQIKRIRDNSAFVILNSLSFLKKGLPVMRHFAKVNLFLDNDPAGKKALHEIEAADGISTKDWSILYPSHKDVNEYLTDPERIEKAERRLQRRKGFRR